MQSYIEQEAKVFQNTDNIKQIKIYPPDHKGTCQVIMIYEKKRNCIQDYLHKVTRTLVDYCVDHDIRTVVIGDITNIRKDNHLGKVTNQKLHALPYAKLYGMLEYKLALCGISLKKQTEEYTSQCSPHAPEVTKDYAKRSDRMNRGLYKDQFYVYNADAVGAFNIMRKYIAVSGKKKEMPVIGLSSPEIIKVAV